MAEDDATVQQVAKDDDVPKDGPTVPLTKWRQERPFDSSDFLDREPPEYEDDEAAEAVPDDESAEGEFAPAEEA